MNRYDLSGQVAVITGGAQGIGRAIAERMVESGAAIAIWDMDAALAEKTATELGGGSKAYAVDVCDFEAVNAAAQAVSRDMGRLDILVSSAGIAGPNMKNMDYPLEDWRQILDINLSGVFHCCKAVLPFMTKAGYGRIVNIASVAGKDGNPNAGPYSTSKAGVIGLTKSLGKEHADQDIAINCVTPAAARTRIFDQMSEEHINFMLSKIPRGRFLDVTEAASMITWLCTKENSFSTGAVFDLSGGRATY